MDNGYHRETYNRWQQEKHSGQIVLRGRILKTFREKRRLVLIMQAGEYGSRFRLLLEEEQPSYEDMRKLHLSGALMAVRASVQDTGADMVTARIEESMIVSLPELPVGRRALSLTGGRGTFEKAFYHLKLCNDERTILYLRLRDKVFRDLRAFLNEGDFCECVIPALQKNYYGGDANPFTTHVNFAHRDYYLKPNSNVAFLLHLAGGMEKMYEISDYFRNGGVDSLHSVPYCALELYAAYFDYEEIRELAWQIFRRIARSVSEWHVRRRTETGEQPGEITQESPAVETTFHRLLSEKCGENADQAGIRALRLRLTGESSDSAADNTGWVYRWMKKELFRGIEGPCAVTDLPAGVSPLIRTQPDRPEFLKRGYIIWGGSKVIEFFEGENDCGAALGRLQEQESGQSGAAVRRDYRALEHAFALGIPPYASLTVSLDRMIAIGMGNVPVSTYRMDL